MREVVSEKSNRQNAFELYAVSGSDVIKACKVDSDGKVVEGESCGFTGTAPMRDRVPDCLSYYMSYIQANFPFSSCILFCINCYMLYSL